MISPEKFILMSHLYLTSGAAAVVVEIWWNNWKSRQKMSKKKNQLHITRNTSKDEMPKNQGEAKMWANRRIFTKNQHFEKFGLRKMYLHLKNYCFKSGCLPLNKKKWLKLKKVLISSSPKSQTAGKTKKIIPGKNGCYHGFFSFHYFFPRFCSVRLADMARGPVSDRG